MECFNSSLSGCNIMNANTFFYFLSGTIFLSVTLFWLCVFWKRITIDGIIKVLGIGIIVILVAGIYEMSTMPKEFKGALGKRLNDISTYVNDHENKMQEKFKSINHRLLRLEGKDEDCMDDICPDYDRGI